MLRRRVLVLALAGALFVTGTGVALAWDQVHNKSGFGRVTLRAWTRNYNQVAFIADHTGTRVDVEVVVDCRDGYHFEQSWSDGGRRFRFILQGLEDNGRCNHTFKVFANDPDDRLDLALYARG
jgi:hypothetical protein